MTADFCDRQEPLSGPDDLVGRMAAAMMDMAKSAQFSKDPGAVWRAQQPEAYWHQQARKRLDRLDPVARRLLVRETEASGDGMAADPVTPQLKFSHERDACICNLWDGPLSALWSAVDQLPGPRVTADEIVNRATKALGLPPRPARSTRVPVPPKHSVSSPRIAGEAPAVPRASSTSQTTAAVQRQPDATGCVPAIFSEIAAWAAPHGLKYDGSNMDKVNRLRSLFRAPPFVQIESAAVRAQ